MAAIDEYTEHGPSREEVDKTCGPLVLEFGANWCGYCQAARPLIAEAVADYPTVTHVKVADGPGRLLGRSFRVKLWPTLIFLRNGQEVARSVRPQSVEEVRRGLEAVRG